MSKKMVQCILAVVCSAFFALPAVASAQEIHLEPSSAFSISGPGCELRAEGEPTITCEAIDGSGKFDAGSTTTGSVTFDFTGCHITVFGFTAKCRSEGSALDNTVAVSGTFHLITWKNAAGTSFPAVLITFPPIKIVSAGISTLTYTGSVIGTITSPACGSSSKEVKFSFTATSSTQNHIAYTGVNYDLRAYTGSETANEKTGAFVATYTQQPEVVQKLNCT